ncbi:MAG TPA: transglycosylase SLT domain-containing protein [Hyalangium sp.]|nr:transglycosylase SLT domain-containing protein [Hyalangium sp.]
MVSPVSSRPSSSSHNDLGSSIRSRVSEGLSRSPAGKSSTSAGPGGLSDKAAGSTAAAEAQRIRQSVMSRISDGFDRSSTPGSKPGGTSPTGPSGLGGTPSQPPMKGSSPAEKPYDLPGMDKPTDTSGVPKSGNPMLDQWDGTIAKEAKKWGVPPENLKALIALESGGDPNATQINPTHGNTYGLAQINQSIWGGTAAQRGYDLNSPEGQIGFAASLLRDHYNQTGSWDQAHSMYFNPSGTGDSVNGTSNAQYIAKIHELINSWS